MKKVIVCDRTLSVIKQALTVGFIKNKSKHITNSSIGTSQGSVLSPLLANIVLHELDVYLEESVIPDNTKGKRIRANPECNALSNIRYFRKSATQEEKNLALKKMLTLRPPPRGGGRYAPRGEGMDNRDPYLKRSMYLRYGDDFVFLFEGPIDEAQVIKKKIQNFLLDKVGLELNDEKTVITHINKGFHFLGAHVKNLRHVNYGVKTKTIKGTPITLRANVRARINMPTEIMIEKLIKNKFAHRNVRGLLLTNPQTNLVNLDHATIVQFYNSKIHGILNYYSFAANRIEIQNII